jgi:hypothetical protein
VPTVMVRSKAAWRSKVLSFNAIALVALALESAQLADLPFVASPYFLFAVILVNGLMRFPTNRPVTLTGGDMVAVDQEAGVL